MGTDRNGTQELESGHIPIGADSVAGVELSRLVRELREAFPPDPSQKKKGKCLDQTAFAKRSKGLITRIMLNKLENKGNQGTSDRTIAGLATACGVTRDEIVDYLEERISAKEIVARWRRNQAGATEVLSPDPIRHIAKGNTWRGPQVAHALVSDLRLFRYPNLELAIAFLAGKKEYSPWTLGVLRTGYFGPEDVPGHVWESRLDMIEGILAHNRAHGLGADPAPPKSSPPALPQKNK